MSQIRGKNTSIERLAFAYLRRKGIYFQNYCKRVVGQPVVALPVKSSQSETLDRVSDFLGS